MSAIVAINSLVRVAGFYANEASEAVAKGEAPSKDGVEVIEKSLRQVSLNIRALLSFQVSRKFDPTPLRFRATIEELVTSLQLVYPENVIALDVSGLHEDLLFLGDKKMLLLAMVNLITNAFDATETVPKKVKVVIGQSALEGDGTSYLYFSVSDKGRGVAPEIFEKISEPYVTDKKNLGCIGFGLFITKMIAGQHGGFLDVVTQSNVGSTFTLFVPNYELTG
jgi:signal transduction histidine kinase